MDLDSDMDRCKDTGHLILEGIQLLMLQKILLMENAVLLLEACIRHSFPKGV